MKRILALLAAAAVAAAVSASAAQAKVISNETRSLTYSAYVPCANGGAGELITGTIEMHDLVTSTVNANHDTWQFLSQPQGGSMVGRSTGDTYRVTGVTHGSYSESLDTDHRTLTYISSFHLVGPGPGNDLLVRDTAHATIDADDNVVVRHDDWSLVCA
jgi:hypothetical protein